MVVDLWNKLISLLRDTTVQNKANFNCAKYFLSQQSLINIKCYLSATAFVSLNKQKKNAYKN